MLERRATTDRRLSRRLEERRLRSIIEQLADGIVIVGADGVIRFANPAAEQLFARSAQSLEGTEFGFAIAGGGPVEIDVVRPGGQTLTAELRVVEAVWEGEPARLVSIRDVTDRRRAEERARQVERERAARAEAEAANRAKSEFLATMSHELRTPLNAVIGYAQLLDLGIGGTLAPEQQRQVERIAASGRHLLGLVNELLDLAKVDAGRLAVHIAPAPAGAASEAAATLIQPIAEARGVLLTATSVDDGAVHYQGDEDRVRQILVNLLTNAVKFTDGGGHVSLEYGQSTGPAPEARLPDGGVWTYFRVTDNGIGIPADQLARIFEPFVQARSGRTRPNDGSGLGLAISRRLARLMHGDITVRSTVGKGSAFTLWLPAAKPDARGPARRHGTPKRAASPLHGLADIGEILMRELASLLEVFVTRLRAECPTPGAAGLKFSQLADHVASYVADLAGMLIVLEETDGQPSSVLVDATDIHRLVASRHGAQRARLRWTDEAIHCEYRILSEEIERVVRQRGAAIGAPAVDEALAVVTRLLTQAEETSLRAFARAAGTDEGRQPAGDPP
ncbi:MAG TPA: ATP-binding protein [Gemmatimonadaceae bacterium]|nr:ATP-binding protein [Gemmatimonadaceae bacterium]